jgi:NAD(P)H dehydrogenase (quinone)
LQEELMGIKVHVIFYSMYGHVYRMAEAVVAGVKEVAGAEATLFQAAEIASDATLEKSGARAARAAFAHVPVATMDSLAEPQAIIFGTSTATQHGGQETTLTSFHSTLLHHGMIIVGVPYSESGLTNMADISGGTPYGATTLAGPDGSRQPSANELKIARYQGRHVAEIAGKLFR